MSDLDRSLHVSLWVYVAHSSFIEGSHTTKNTASGSWVSVLNLIKILQKKSGTRKRTGNANAATFSNVCSYLHFGINFLETSNPGRDDSTSKKNHKSLDGKGENVKRHQTLKLTCF